jgi:replicative DNA helicase
MIHSIEAEIALIGSALASPDDCTDALERVRPEHFFDGVHGLVWSEVQKQMRAGRADVLTVSAALSGDAGFTQMGADGGSQQGRAQGRRNDL